MPKVSKRPGAKHRQWPLSERPGYLIRRLHQLHSALFQEMCGAFEITSLQYSLLSALAEHGTADQTTLAAAVCLDRTTTTGALVRLASRRLIRRVVDDQDRRARACTLTDAGIALLEKMEGSARAAHDRTLARLTSAERAVFMGLVQRMVD